MHYILYIEVYTFYSLHCILHIVFYLLHCIVTYRAAFVAKMEHELSQTHCTQIVPIYSMQYYSIQYIQYIWLFAHIDKNEYKQFKTCCTHSTKRNMNILKLIAHRLLQYIAMLYILYNIFVAHFDKKEHEQYTIRWHVWLVANIQQKGTWTFWTV